MSSKLLPIFAHNMTAYQEAAHKAGWNRTMCAAKARMSKGQWADLLNGKIPSPGVWTAQRVADVLRCSVDALLTSDPEVRDATVKKVYRAFKLVRNT